MKKVIQLVVGCSISLITLYLVFKDLNIIQLRESLSQIQWWPVIPFIGLFGVHYFFRSLRWRLLLPPPKATPPSLRQLFDSMILGNLATFILPFRIGEFIRPLVLSRWSEYSFASAFVSVVIERFFDLSAVLICFAIIATFLPSLPDWAILGAYSLGALASGLLLFLVLGCLFPAPIKTLVRFCFGPLPRKLSAFALKFAEDLIDGSSVIRTPTRLAAIVGLTGLVWLTAFLQFNALLFILPHNHSFLLSVALGVFVALAIAVPSAPGFFGVFQVGCVAACSLFFYPEAAAQVYSIVVHLLTFLLIVGLGFWLLSVHDLNLFELKRAAEERE